MEEEEGLFTSYGALAVALEKQIHASKKFYSIQKISEDYSTKRIRFQFFIDTNLFTCLFFSQRIYEEKLFWQSAQLEIVDEKLLGLP